MSAVDDRYRVSEGSMTSAAEEPYVIEPASRGRRFANYLIDFVVQVLLIFVLTVCAILIGGESTVAWIESTPDILIGLVIYAVYYIPAEGLTGRTVGKLITRTIVIDAEGRRPTLGQVCGRTLARIIPFEPFSFFGAEVRGWHDSLSKTFVVIKR